MGPAGSLKSSRSEIAWKTSDRQYDCIGSLVSFVSIQKCYKVYLCACSSPTSQTPPKEMRLPLQSVVFWTGGRKWIRCAALPFEIQMYDNLFSRRLLKNSSEESRTSESRTATRSRKMNKLRFKNQVCGTVFLRMLLKNSSEKSFEFQDLGPPPDLERKNTHHYSREPFETSTYFDHHPLRCLQ